eukprot:104717_1
MGCCATVNRTQGIDDVAEHIKFKKISLEQKVETSKHLFKNDHSELLVYGFVQEIQSALEYTIIPIEIIKLCMVYFTHLGQFYFDPRYDVRIWKHDTHQTKMIGTHRRKLSKGEGHCLYILYNKDPIYVHQLGDDEKRHFCTVRYDSHKAYGSTDCWFGIVVNKLPTLKAKRKNYESLVCKWNDKESITIEVDFKRYKIWYYKSYGNEIHFKRYSMMTKRIPIADKYYFMLCGTVCENDTYTLRNIGDIASYHVKPVLFL